MISSLRLPKWHEVLVEIYRTPEESRYCERLNRKLHTSLNHLREIARLLELYGFVTIESGKKVKKITLTEKGSKAAASLQEIKLYLKKNRLNYNG